MLANSAGKFIIVVGLAGTLAACASQKRVISPPTSNNVIKLETNVGLNFQKTWENAVENLTKSYFVINNISKESNIINVSFGLDSNTEKYIDCGYLTLTTDGKTQKVNLSTANEVYPSVYNVGGYTHVGSTRRSQKIEGRINLFIKQSKKQSTLFRVNTRYIVKPTVSRYDNRGYMYRSNSYTISFNSGGEGTSGKIKCRSTGTLERELLALPKS